MESINKKYLVSLWIPGTATSVPYMNKTEMEKSLKDKILKILLRVYLYKFKNSKLVRYLKLVKEMMDEDLLDAERSDYAQLSKFYKSEIRRITNEILRSNIKYFDDEIEFVYQLVPENKIRLTIKYPEGFASQVEEVPSVESLPEEYVIVCYNCNPNDPQSKIPAMAGFSTFQLTPSIK